MKTREKMKFKCPHCGKGIPYDLIFHEWNKPINTQEMIEDGWLGGSEWK